jgi:hypothetical protein
MGGRTTPADKRNAASAITCREPHEAIQDRPCKISLERRTCSFHPGAAEDMSYMLVDLEQPLSLGYLYFVELQGR